jgi:hypothetical protein
MMPEFFQRLVLAEAAESFTLTLGGAGLSSYAIPDGNFLLVWSVQVFPMIDENLAAASATLMASRCAHYYEFDDEKYRKQGFLHRSNLQLTTDGLAPAPVEKIFAPSGGADLMPVFWNFKGEFLTLRIWHMPTPAPIILDVPPRQEGQSVGPYDAATPLLSLWQTGGAGQNWEPDARRDDTSQNRSPRPFSIPANEIKTPAVGPSGASSWPLVNLQVVSYPSDLLKEYLK